MRISVFIVFVIISGICEISAQPSKRANIWYFGYGVGIDFNQNPCKELLGSKFFSPEESFSTVCDKDGKILLYTDGKVIWNAKDSIIKNGTQINISTTSAQGALFIPHPGNDSMIYLFQARSLYLDFGYSLINIFNQNGLGEVISKNNILIFTNPEVGEEKQVAINHANGRDVWVITHRVNTYEYYAYLITDKGLVNCPVVSKTGSITSAYGSEQGYMSVTSDGALISNPFMITSKTNFNGMVDISKFNNQTGVVSNTIVVDGFKLLPFSTCFSPDGTKLYVNELEGFIYQLDLKHLQKDSIKNNLDTILKVRVRGNEAMYLAPDNSIYINNYNKINNQYRPGIIGKPDLKGKNCAYSDTCHLNFRQYLPGAGLPNFNRSYLYNPDIELYYEFNKTEGSLRLKPYDTFEDGLRRRLWVVNVHKKDSVSFSGENDTTITLSDTGLFLLRYEISNGKTKTKTLDNSIWIRPEFLGNDTAICPLKPFIRVLQAPNGMHCYLWNNGKTSDSIHVSKPGKYAVLVTLPSMIQVRDTISIDNLSPPEPIKISLSADTLKATGGLGPFLWYKNGIFLKQTTSPVLIISENGYYTVSATDSTLCFNLTDSITAKGLAVNNFIQEEKPQVVIKNGQITIIPEDAGDRAYLYDISGRLIFQGYTEELQKYTLPSQSWVFLAVQNAYGRKFHYKLFNP